MAQSYRALGAKLDEVSPLFVVIYVALGVCACVWTASLITHDYSWVDRIWSIVPVVYVWIFAGFAGLANARLDVMAVLVTLWGARLTFNFARKGGYSGVEDYRWAVLRGRMSRWQFQLFNFFFIVLYQNLILLLIALPALTAWNSRATPFGILDAVVTVVFFALLVAETVSDQQQWSFQAWKKSEAAAGRQPSPRFLQTGLWRFSRHPNFFFEQAQWWALFFFGVVAAGSILQWTVVGAFLLTILFVGSTSFTESISKSKYPEYADYQASTSAVVPWFPRRTHEAAATG
jgi:steroid 5-alpha reductase family enzyme